MIRQQLKDDTRELVIDTKHIEIMQMVELLDMETLGPPTESAETLWQMARICQQVFVDGAMHRDPKYHEVPFELITSKEYAEARFKLLQMDAPLPETAMPDSSMRTVVAGDQIPICVKCWRAVFEICCCHS